MTRSLRRMALIAGMVALATGSTASIAAGNSATVAAVSAAAAAAAQSQDQASPAVANSQGLPAGTGFFPGAILPIGVVVAAGILAVVLASKGNSGSGKGFSPN